jgi:hypothetical protein
MDQAEIGGPEMDQVRKAVQWVIDFAKRGSLETFITAAALIVFAALAKAAFAEDDARITFHDRHPDVTWGMCENGTRDIAGERFQEVTC